MLSHTMNIQAKVYYAMLIGRIGQSGWMVILVTATDYLPQHEEWVKNITNRYTTSGNHRS